MKGIVYLLICTMIFLKYNFSHDNSFYSVTTAERKQQRYLSLKVLNYINTNKNALLRDEKNYKLLSIYKYFVSIFDP